MTKQTGHPPRLFAGKNVLRNRAYFYVGKETMQMDGEIQYLSLSEHEAEVARLKEENATLRHEFKMLQSGAHNQAATLTATQAALEKAVEALEFYSEKKNYEEAVVGVYQVISSDGITEDGEWVEDLGQIATEALAEIRQLQGKDKEGK